MNSSKDRRATPRDPAGTPIGPGGAAAKPSVHNRFIPREEVHSVAAWKPGAFAEDQTRTPPSVVRPSKAPAPPPPAPEDPAATLRAARQGGYQDGYRDGLVALEAFKQSHARQLSAQIGALVASFDAQLDALEVEMANALASATTELARQVVRQELKTHPRLIAGVAREALASLLLAARHVTVQVHPDDLPLVAQGAGEDLERRGARLVAVASIARGGCFVESDLGVVDASIEMLWQRAASGLGDDAPIGTATVAPASAQAGPDAGDGDPA